MSPCAMMMMPAYYRTGLERQRNQLAIVLPLKRGESSNNHAALPQIMCSTFPVQLCPRSRFFLFASIYGGVIYTKRVLAQVVVSVADSCLLRRLLPCRMKHALRSRDPCVRLMVMMCTEMTRLRTQVRCGPCVSVSNACNSTGVI